MDFNGIPHSHSYPTPPPMGGPTDVMGHGDPMMAPGMMEEHYVPPPHDNGMYQPAPSHHDTGSFSELHSILVDGGDRFGVSHLCFDTQDLLWMGNQGGHVTSYYGTELQKYTSFQVHNTEDIRQIVPLERGILSLTQGSLRCSLRRGLSVFTYTGANMHNMQCMLMTSGHSVLIGGHQTKALQLDLEMLKEIRTIDIPEPGCAILRSSNKFICAGDTGGKVTLYDPNTMNPEHVLDAHSGTLSDFDVQGNLLVTCGFSNRLNSMTVDRFLMVYDMRVMRAMSPIQVVIDPMFLKFIPSFSNRIALVSQAGQFQVIETTAMTPSSMMMYPINTQGGFVTSFDISSSCQALAFGDTGGYLHLFATGEQATFNTYHHAPEFADHLEPLQHISITDELTPLSIIPMVYPTNGTLLSDWPDHFCERTYRKPKKIDPEILRTMKIQHNVGYAKNLGKECRNQTPYHMKTEKKKGKSGVPESPLGRGEDPFFVVPKRFRKVDLKYSKLGLEDFDFRLYNKTHFAGLETHIPNAYCNCMLQVLYFIEPLRCTLLSHLCDKEFCLSCELGFLFHMLDKQKGQASQASNFLRAFRTVPEAAALGLVLAENEENEGHINLSRLVQSWQRFMFPQIHSEILQRVLIEDTKDEAAEAANKTEDEKSPDKPTETTPPKSRKKKKKKGKKKGKEPTEEEEKDKGGSQGDEKEVQETPVEEVYEETSVLSNLMHLKMITTLKCRCGLETQKTSDNALINLSYPDCSPPGPNKPPVMFSFAQVLKHSMMMEQTTQAWCNECSRYQPHTRLKVIQNLPDILAFNCGLENVRDFEFWLIQQMLMKQQREESGENVTSTNTAPHMPASTQVMCRYGRSCTRKGCRFKHEPGHGDKDKEPEEDLNSIWIPLGLKVELTSEGRVELVEIPDDEPIPKEEDPNVKYYELYATVAHIKDSKSGGNLVTHINVGETYHYRKENVTCTQWYLFNDFSITPVEKHEAVQFNLDWKVPCTIYFMRRQVHKHYDIPVKNPISADILFEDTALVNPQRRKVSFTPLSPEEIPKEGEIIALDAEFVSLNQEESELRSDGTRSTIKPSHLTVARISCIRGQGEKCGEPFIDDYISTQEQVVDYLTQFSGIKPGDLDPTVSSKHLTTLKSTYQKLRYLVDAGCLFVGHGLKKDFRVINIRVPKDQVIDTVELFHIPRQRMISLKFLAWYFLKLNIQSTTHDSVEDAHTALQLYLKYQEMSKEGMDKVRATIKEMYEEGRRIQWKIPDLEEEEQTEEQVALL